MQIIQFANALPHCVTCLYTLLLPIVADAVDVMTKIQIISIDLNVFYCKTTLIKPSIIINEVRDIRMNAFGIRKLFHSNNIA